MLGRRIVLDKYSAYYHSKLTGKIHVVDWKRQDLIVREFKKALAAEVGTSAAFFFGFVLCFCFRVTPGKCEAS